MTKVSIAMTTYNGQKFLQQQLDSIMAQTRTPDELVVCDDQSSDDTWDILSRFSATSPFPTHLHRNKTRLGFRHNFMRTLSFCKGDLIALCDQDDVWREDKLDCAVTALKRADVVLFVHNSWLIDGEGRRTKPGDLFVMARENPPLLGHWFWNPGGFSMVFNRSLLQFSDLWNRSTACEDRTLRAPHDQWLFFLATVFGTIIYSDERLTNYRIHGNNTVGPPARKPAIPRSRADWRARVSNPARNLRELAEATQDRAEILALSQQRLSGEWRNRAVEGERRYRALAFRLEARARLYELSAISERIRQFAVLYRGGSYRLTNGWGYGRSALARDFLLGVCLRPMLVADSDAG